MFACGSSCVPSNASSSEKTTFRSVFFSHLLRQALSCFCHCAACDRLAGPWAPERFSARPHIAVLRQGLQIGDFTWALGIQTQVHSLEGKCFYLLSHFLGPCFKFLLAFINYTSVVHVPVPVNNPSCMFL